MRFDCDGNLFLYEPGVSGEPRRVIEMGSDEVVYYDEDKKITESKFDSVKIPPAYQLVPQKGRSVVTETKSDLR